MKESNLPVTLVVGQEGLSDAIVGELRAQIQKRKVIKAKRLRSSLDERPEKEFWAELAEKAGAKLMEVRGHTAILADPRYETEREREKRQRRREA